MTISDVFDQCHRMLDEEWGYIWGTSGIKWSEKRQKNLENKYSDDDPNYGMSVKYGKKWIGHMVTDCSGVMCYIWKQFGLTIPHGSSQMVSKGYIVDFSSVPIPGYAALIDPTPDTPDNKHIGIVDETGKYVYEAKGTQAGFVKSELSKTRFNKFGRFKQVDYDPSAERDDYVINYYAKVSTNNGKLNVRSGPSTEYPITGKLNKGEIVGVLMEEGDWAYIVDHENNNGYVSRKYLTQVDAPKEDPQEYKYCIRIECKSQEEAEQFLECLKNAQVIREMV